jgi:ribosome-associated toxin RatA of RatAB toxin-antitoxin module
MVRSQVGESMLFSHLDSTWGFEPGPTPASVWLTFDIDFAFKSSLYRQLADVFFEEVVQRMIGAFEGRCQQLYGQPSQVSQLEEEQAKPVSELDARGTR